MKAPIFIEKAQEALRRFEHGKPECAGEDPEVMSNPNTGDLGMGCRTCGRVIVVTQIEKHKTADDEPSIIKPGGLKPRFKMP